MVAGRTPGVGALSLGRGPSGFRRGKEKQFVTASLKAPLPPLGLFLVPPSGQSDFLPRPSGQPRIEQLHSQINQ